MVLSVGVTPEARRAVSGSEDQTLRVWDLETGTCLRTLKGHTAGVRSVSVTPEGRRMVSGSRDRTVRVWDLETGACLAVAASTAPIIACGCNSRVCAAGPSSGAVIVFEVQGLKPGGAV